MGNQMKSLGSKLLWPKQGGGVSVLLQSARQFVAMILFLMSLKDKLTYTRFSQFGYLDSFDPLKHTRSWRDHSRR